MNKDPKEDNDKLNDSFDDFLKDLSDRDQPDVCDINDEDCEACGS
tara:strand:+ start:193 stop:327 length:135 start_codon:yes stop_codon:yes gene_type:complete